MIIINLANALARTIIMKFLHLLALRYLILLKNMKTKISPALFSRKSRAHHMQTGAIRTFMHIARMDVSIPRVSMAYQWISIVISRGQQKGELDGPIDLA